MDQIWAKCWSEDIIISLNNYTFEVWKNKIRQMDN